MQHNCRKRNAPTTCSLIRAAKKFVSNRSHAGAALKITCDTTLQIEAVGEAFVPLLDREFIYAQASHTIFVTPPDPPKIEGATTPPLYVYDSMPLKLKKELFALDQLNSGE